MFFRQADIFLLAIVGMALSSSGGCGFQNNYQFSPAHVVKVYGELMTESGGKTIRVKITSLTGSELNTLAEFTRNLHATKDEKYQGRGYIDLTLNDGTNREFEFAREVVRFDNGDYVVRSTDEVNEMLDEVIKRALSNLKRNSVGVRE